MFVHDYLREHIYQMALNNSGQKQKLPSLESLKQTEWSSKFESLMRNRLIMGAIRYGLLHAPGKPKYDRIESIKKRLDQYIKTGNAEFLVDSANLCLLEFEEPNHPKFHWKTIDDGEHVKELL